MYIQLLNLLASVITKKVTRSASPQFTTAPSNEKHVSAVHGEISLRESHAPVYSVLRPVITSLHCSGIFFIFVFKKNKISKIYGGFEKFQNYTPVAPCLGNGACRPLAGRQDLNVKKITFRPWHPGHIKQ